MNASSARAKVSYGLDMAVTREMCRAEGAAERGYRMFNRCPICATSIGIEGYGTHYRTAHSVNTVNDGSTGRLGLGMIVPVKLTNRGNKQIIQEAEWTMGRAIIPDTRPMKY